MSHLQNKSEILKYAAELLHDKSYYPAVAHSTYYSCYQLLKHIWLYSLHKTEANFTQELGLCKATGSHEFLINAIGKYIKNSSKKTAIDDFDKFSEKIGQLKRLRRIADYEDSSFDISKSSSSLSLATDIIPILKKY
jgi:hypothetical protein